MHWIHTTMFSSQKKIPNNSSSSEKLQVEKLQICRASLEKLLTWLVTCLSIQGWETLLVWVPSADYISWKADKSQVGNIVCLIKCESRFIRLCGKEIVRVIQICRRETCDWKSEVGISKYSQVSGKLLPVNAQACLSQPGNQNK